MGRASIDQSSFLGGEWGPLAYGRHDDPRYSTALALSLNGYPVEEGAWTKRSGTEFILPTVGRGYANILPFEGSETCSFAMEFTNDKVRLLTQRGAVCTNDAKTITATNNVTGQIFLDTHPSWSVGDIVQFVFPDVTSPLYPYPLSLEGNMRSNVFLVSSNTSGVPATGTATFSTNPAVNDTLTINSVTITFVASGATGNQVNIGATLADTIANLYLFLILSGSGFLTSQTYAPVNGNEIYIQYGTVGTGGNSITLAKSSSVITLSGATLTGGSATGALLVVTDDLGNPVPSSTIYPWPWGALVGAQVLHHNILATPYGTVPVLSTLRAVQAEVNSIVLSNSYAPYEFQITTEGTLSADPVISFNKLTLIDGPYLDPQDQSLTLSAVTGSITLTAGSAVFAATDVGRAVRIFTQPPIYNPASTYTAGDQVTDSQGAWWTAIGSVDAGTNPGSLQTVAGVPTIVWSPAPTAGSWAWGLITSYSSSTSVGFTFDTTIPGMVLNSGNGTTAAEWQMGVYSDTTGYPTCGTFYEGRLWLAGCVLNRFDTTTSNGVSQVIGTNTATFSPTDPNGNVLDDSGLSEILNSQGINQIQWMLSDEGGVLMGTLHGETLVGASTLGDPITPTSIQAHEHTRYGSLGGIDAIRAGMAVLFPQKFGRRVIEYLYDSFSGKPAGRHLNPFSKHLTQAGIAKMAYTEEPVPIVWALMNNGMLAGCTYRRYSRFVQTPPEASGWHWNLHGGNRMVTNMCSVPGKDGLLERLFLVTNPAPPASSPTSPTQSNYYIEVMQPLLDPGNATTSDWFLDQVGGGGPGNSGYDCGGNNPSGFFTSGFARGADSSSNSPPDLFANFTGGQSPPWGGVNILGKGNAVFFPGSVGLYNLPKRGSNTTQLSMSCWVGTADFPYKCGMLLGSPALTFAKASATTHIVSGLLGGPSPGINNTSPQSILAISQWGLGYPGPAELDIALTNLAPSLHWSHIMISAKTDGSGNIVVTAAVNDTVIYNAMTQGTVGNNNPMWSFASEQDSSGDNGIDCWTIGGANCCDPLFDLKITETGIQQVEQIPGVAGLLKGPGVGFQGLYPLTLLPPGATIQQIQQALRIGYTKVFQTIISQVTGGGGPQNLPYETPQGVVPGFFGNVAELWIQPGVFIDWTSSTNRNKFHEYDSVSNSWGPIPLGTTGGTPGFGTPWVYLSGGPRYFPFNRANDVALTEIDTAHGPIDYDTGLTGGLVASDLPFP